MIEVDLFEGWARSLTQQAVFLAVKQPAIQTLKSDEMERVYAVLGSLSDDLQLVQQRIKTTRATISRLYERQRREADILEGAKNDVV